MPIVNVIVAAALVFSAVYAGILFQGKEGLKIVGYIVAGALVIKFMAKLLKVLSVLTSWFYYE